MASATARIASTRPMIGMTHLSLTIRLNSPENFETCCFETTVKCTLLVDSVRSGSKYVMPR